MKCVSSLPVLSAWRSRCCSDTQPGHCGAPAWGRLAAGSESGEGEMVDVPASPVRQLPHQRLARSETTSGRLVQVLQGSSSRLFARKNTPETVSSPRSRTNWLTEVVDLDALAR